jgi:hypothetical protein
MVTGSSSRSAVLRQLAPPVRAIVTYDLALRATAQLVSGGRYGRLNAGCRRRSENELLRKDHHPKIVQQADGQWLVECHDCLRDQDSTPIGINTPVGSREMAQRLWENHTWGPGATPRRRFAERKWS